MAVIFLFVHEKYISQNAFLSLSKPSENCTSKLVCSANFFNVFLRILVQKIKYIVKNKIFLKNAFYSKFPIGERFWSKICVCLHISRTKIWVHKLFSYYFDKKISRWFTKWLWDWQKTVKLNFFSKSSILKISKKYF